MIGLFKQAWIHIHDSDEMQIISARVRFMQTWKMKKIK